MATISSLDLNGSGTGLNESRTVQEGASTLLAPSAALSASGNFNGQSLRLSGLLAEAQIGFGSGVSLSGTAVRVGGVTVGSVTGGSNGADFVISFNSNATQARVQTVLRNLTYTDTSDTPTTSQTISFNLAGTVRTDAITVVPVNDRPVLDLNGAASGTGVSLSHQAGAAAVPLAAMATVTDIDSPNFGGGSLRVALSQNGSASDQLRILTDTTVTMSGTTLQVGGTGIGTVAGGTNGADLVVSLNTNATAAAVQALLQHVGFSTAAGASTAQRQITFTLNDGDGTANGGQAVATAAATVTLATGQANVAPTLTGDLTATIANASTYQLTTSDIFYTDPDDGPAGVTFTVSNLDNGYVRRDGTAVASFTAEQLAAGRITYWHDGSEPVGSFRISVEDGNEDGSTPVAQTFVFNVTTGAVNVAPTLTGDLKATVASGGTYVLGQADLFYTDPDDSAPGVAFTISSVTGGTVLVGGVAATSFTPQQLSAGQVAFRHNGIATAPSFAVSVDDGNEDGSVPVARNFVLDVSGGTGGNVAPTLTGDLTAAIANSGTYQFTTSDIFYTDPDDGPAGVTFTISDIDNGDVRRDGTAVTSFTAEELAAGRISYWHDGSEPVGSFRISVEDGNEDGSTPVAQTFVFDVGGGGGGGGSMLDLSGAARGVRADLGAAQWALATRVMALGDSITNGDAPEGQDEHGYRGFFYQNVVGAGHLVDMVGPNSNGQVPDPQHAGYPGETGDDIQALLPGLLSTYAPSAILLMAGTNDIFYKSNPQVPVRAEIAAMLDHVAQASPTTHVYVSTLLPLAGYATQVTNVNAAIRSAVADAVARGQNVSLVEMPSVTLSDLFDGIHPTDTGYREMAGYWTTAFLANPPATGATTAINAAVTVVTGSPFNDLMIGDGRANTLSGGAGADWIRGEGGNDLLTGGAGRDVFVFGPSFGQDTVQDFVRGEDVLDFRALALGVGDFSSWRQSHVSTSGSDAVVTIEAGQSVTLKGVSASALQASDFLFL